MTSAHGHGHGPKLNRMLSGTNQEGFTGGGLVNVVSWSSLLEGHEGCIGPSGVSCCVYHNPEKIMQHMHGNIPYLFDFWANPFVHLILLRSYMAESLFFS